MTIEDIAKNANAKIVAGKIPDNQEVEQVFASDLMSDVLTIATDKNLLLITGLANIQTIRTCEMSDISIILFVRGKKVTPEMKELAEEHDMVLLETDFSMYRTSGLLFAAGLSPVY